MKPLQNSQRRQASKALPLLALLLTGVGLHAADADKVDPIAADSTLSQLIAHAVDNNDALRAAQLRWDAARQAVAQARGWPDPRVTYGYFAEPVETRVGPQEHRIGVMQPLLWFGKLKAAGDVASEDAAAALAEVEAVRLTLIEEIKQVWHELYVLEQSLRITRDNMDLLRQFEAVAQTQFRAGGSMAPVNKAQVELGTLQDRLTSMQELRAPLQGRMNALLNRPQHAPLPAAITLVETSPALPDASVLFTWQAEASPILGVLGSRIDRETHAVDLARKQGMPNFGVGVDYIVTGPASVAGTTDSGKDAVIAMLSLDIPLWRGKYKAAVQEARARQAAAASEFNDQSNHLAAQLEMALYQHRDADRKVHLYSETLLPQAQGALNVARQSYEVGSSDFLDLIDTQRVLLEFELNHQRAIANREQARAKLEMLVGRPLVQSATRTPTEEAP
jgi:outer membrane protein TolC